MPVCYICNNSFPTISNLIIHLKYIHKLNEFSIYRCREDTKCQRDFLNAHSFKAHLRKKHAICNPELSNILCTPNENSDSSKNDIKSSYSNYDSEMNCSTSEQIDDFNFQITLFMSKLYNIPSLTKATIDIFYKSMTNLFDFVFQHLIKQIESICGHQQLLKPLFDSVQYFKETLSLFKTEYLRMKHFKNLKYLTPPLTVTVGSKIQEVKLPCNEVTLQNVNVSMQYIPMANTLTNIFEMSNYFNEVLKNVKTYESNDAVVTNFIQSELWKSKKSLFKKDEIVLPLFIYFDDYETGNALGSHAGVNKLGAVYFSLPFLPAQFKSEIDNIFLTLLFHTDDRKTFGNQVIFKPLIEELQNMETNGIIIKLNNMEKKIYFVLGLILGDNLGMHSILGFSESFSANFTCRFCKVHKTELHYNCTQNDQLLRTVENYKDDVLTNDVSKTGIKEFCIWNKLKSFHVTENYAVDIMHDVLEGVCHYDLILILKHFIINMKYFSLDTLNSRLRKFNYEIDNCNKPPILGCDFHKKQKLSMSASEMMCFFMYFGLIIGDLVPQNNCEWQLYLSLREILDIILSTKVSREICINLQILIAEHHSLYVKLFNETLKPKHHFLVHYPFIMSKVGPLVDIWSMRFESKHRQSKLTANVICSRKNITYSLAFKHQLRLCYRLLANAELENKLDIGAGDIFNIQTIENYSQFSDVLPDCLRQDNFFTNRIHYNGTDYKTGYIIISDIVDLEPQFAVIENIIITSKEIIYFVCSKLHNVKFCEHVLAFEVKTTNNFCVFDMNTYCRWKSVCKPETQLVNKKQKFSK